LQISLKNATKNFYAGIVIHKIIPCASCEWPKSFKSFSDIKFYFNRSW